MRRRRRQAVDFHNSIGRPVESFNGRLRDECLNETVFTTLKEAIDILEAWRIDYNTIRPHTSLGGLTPAAFATRPTEGHNLNRLYL